METPNFGRWVTDEDIEAQLRGEFTRGAPRVCAPEPQSMDFLDAQCAGKSYGDSSAELWLMYLSKTEEQVREISEGRKEDVDDVLVFTSLFSATVAIFLMESYKLLSPDLSIAVVATLTQITYQLASISDGAPFQNVVVQADAPFKPTASAVRINVMWLLSLILSLTYALSAARPYWGFAQYPGAQRKYAHTFRGVVTVVDSRPTLIHLSIFLFIAGLVDFLLLINKTVAFCVIGYVSAFSFACLVSTASPSLYLVTPPFRDFPGKYP